MKFACYALFALLAVSFGVAATPNESIDAAKWEKAKKAYILQLSESNPGVKASAAGFIRKYNIIEAVGALKEVLECENCETVKISAALAVLQVAGKEGLTIIENAMKTEENELVITFYRSILRTDSENIDLPVTSN